MVEKYAVQIGVAQRALDNVVLEEVCHQLILQKAPGSAPVGKDTAFFRAPCKKAFYGNVWG